MTQLKSLNDQLAAIRAEQAKVSARLGDIAAERFELEAASSDGAAAVYAAELALVAALAAVELGEKADVEAARQHLRDAQAQAGNGIESAQRLRVLDALTQRLEAEHGALHERGLSIMATLKQAEVERLTERAAELIRDTENAFAIVAKSESLLSAVRDEMRERGASWPFEAVNEQRITYARRITPNQARAEIARALAA